MITHSKTALKRTHVHMSNDSNISGVKTTDATPCPKYTNGHLADQIGVLTTENKLLWGRHAALE